MQVPKICTKSPHHPQFVKSLVSNMDRTFKHLLSLKQSYQITFINLTIRLERKEKWLLTHSHSIHVTLHNLSNAFIMSDISSMCNFWHEFTFQRKKSLSLIIMMMFLLLTLSPQWTKLHKLFINFSQHFKRVLSSLELKDDDVYIWSYLPINC